MIRQDTAVLGNWIHENDTAENQSRFDEVQQSEFCAGRAFFESHTHTFL